ncbi:hypothetical protein BGZ81_002933 [Podila clonocystis]|nr:hypothetical protein BGZ81_002933 [Podila clonocystis]
MDSCLSLRTLAWSTTDPSVIPTAVKGNNTFRFWCLGCVSFTSKRDDGYNVIGDVGNDEYRGSSSVL